MEALGHNRMAVHRAYAKKAQMKVPALEEYQTAALKGKVIRLPQPETGRSEDQTTHQAASTT
jgi:hypothetical protein